MANASLRPPMRSGYRIPQTTVSSTFPFAWRSRSGFPMPDQQIALVRRFFVFRPPDTDMRKVGSGACGGLGRPEKRCRSAVLARRLPTPRWYAADQMGKVEISVPVGFLLRHDNSGRLSSAARCARLLGVVHVTKEEWSPLLILKSMFALVAPLIGGRPSD